MVADSDEIMNAQVLIHHTEVPANAAASGCRRRRAGCARTSDRISSTPSTATTTRMITE